MNSYAPVVRYACTHCRGLGWVSTKRGVSDWANHCRECEGRGSFSAGDVARKIGEHHENIERLNSGRCRAKTAARLFDKIVQVFGAP